MAMRLRKARAEIFAEQETVRQAALDERARLLKAMRMREQEEVQKAKAQISADIAAARLEIDRDTPALAGDIARVVLQRPSPRRGGAAQ